MNIPLKLLLLVGLMVVTLPGLAQDATGTNLPARIVFEATDFDFGKVDSGVLIKHDFLFTNTGNQVLELSEVRPSCGCTSTGDWDKKVDPGKTGKIHIEFNTMGYGGQVHKTIFVTCNDSNQPNITLNLLGTIWKPINISPAYAIFNLRPEGQEDVTNKIKIVNETDELITVTEPSCGNPAFHLELRTVQEGKEFELLVTAIASKVAGTMSSPITLKTSSRMMPQISVTAFAMVPPLLAINPPQITLPAGTLKEAATFTITIQDNSTNSVTLTEPKVNVDGVDIQLAETQPGRLFNLTINFPAGFKCESGQQVQASVKTTSPKYPVITIPIFQQAPPAAQTPATQSGTSAAKSEMNKTPIVLSK